MYRVYTEIPTSHLHLTRSYTLVQLTPEEPPGSLITFSIGCISRFRLSVRFVPSTNSTPIDINRTQK